MRAYLTLVRRELGGFFVSLTGYVVIASVLLLQSAHPGSAVFVATGDLNLQTKLAAVRLPFIELPD